MPTKGGAGAARRSALARRVDRADRTSRDQVDRAASPGRAAVPGTTDEASGKWRHGWTACVP
jgi:hypothetical protein